MKEGTMQNLTDKKIMKKMMMEIIAAHVLIMKKLIQSKFSGLERLYN